MKERVTLTIESDILRQVDKTIDGYNIKNRSHAVELLLLRSLGTNKPKIALILAGGKGERFKPITHEIPKPMIPLNGKPLIEHTMDLLKKYGIKDVIISLGYLGDKVKEYFGNGARFGLSITYIEEKSPLGTAGPLRMAKPLIRSTFLVCNADELKEIDLVDMFIFHKENHAKATIALTTVKNPSEYGVARLNGNKIIEFIEKPKNPPTNLINAGLYIMEPEVIDLIPEGYAMLETDVFPKIAKAGKLFGYSFSGYWKPVGNLTQYNEAITDLKKGKFQI